MSYNNTVVTDECFVKLVSERSNAMSPLIIAILVIVGIAAVPISFLGWKWRKRRIHKKLIEKHDELFRSIFPAGDEQKEMSRPLLEQTLKEVDAHIAFLERAKSQLERNAFVSPLGVDFGLEFHSQLLTRITAAKDVRKFVVQVGNQSGLGFVEEPEEDVDANTNAANTTPTAQAS